MRFARTFVLAFLSLVSAFAAFAQQTATSTTPPSPLTKDPRASLTAQQCLATMGAYTALAFADSLATGHAQIFKPDGTSTVLPITKKSKGTTMIRTDLQRPEGMQSRIINNGTAAIQRADGSVQSLITNNTVAERVEHIPALSLLSEWASADKELLFAGSDTVNGQPADVISISYIPSDAHDPAFWRTTTRMLFYIDRSTRFVTKIQYQSFAENNTNLSKKIEIFFSNYQVVSGVSVPFQLSTYPDGRLLSTITFSSIAFNVGLASSDFNLPAGKGN